MAMRLIALSFILIKIASGCVDNGGKTVCGNITFTPDFVVNTNANVLIIENSHGILTKKTFSQLDKVKELTLTSNDFPQIETGALCSMPNLTAIYIRRLNGNLPKLNRGILSDCDKLHEIQLDSVGFEDGAFADATGLQRLKIIDGIIDKIDRLTFQGLKFLKSLVLQRCRIRQIAEDAFDELKNVEYLDLQGNELAMIKKNTFRKLSKLVVLSLSSNKLTKFDQFDGLKSLRVLFLQRNPFDNIDGVKIFENLPLLNRIFLSYDKLTPQAIHTIDSTFPKRNITVIYIDKQL